MAEIEAGDIGDADSAYSLQDESQNQDTKTETGSDKKKTAKSNTKQTIHQRKTKK